MHNRRIDFLIIGQGIAGTIFSWKLYQEGISFHIVDAASIPSSTQAAAGLMNPITGKFLALSWEYETLYPIAVSTYNQMFEMLGMSPITSIPIVRGLKDQRMLNDWQYRSTQERYESFIGELPDLNIITDRIKKYPAYGATNHSFQIPIAALIRNWRKKMILENHLIDEPFDHASQSFSSAHETFQYQETDYQYVVFCEGSHVLSNPYFNYLPFDPAKGDVLLVRIPNWTTDFIYKDQLFIAPWYEKDVYWIGSNYEWNTRNWSPTEAKRDWLIKQFESMYTGPYEILDQIAGIRPAVKDRKPLLGEHPDIPGMFLFNGLGTKGTSLAPYCTELLFQHIQNGKKLPSELAIGRFEKT